MLGRRGADDPELIVEAQSPIRSGVKWNTAGQLASRFASLLFGLVLARVLDPESFGLFGLANSVVALGLVFSDIGVGQALVQRQRDIRENAAAAFFMNLVAVALFAIMMILISGPAASFYDQPVVQPLLITLSGAFFIRGLVAVHEAYMRKRMRFRRLQVINIAGVVVYGCVAIVLSASGAGAWSLVLGVLAGNVVYAVAVLIGSGMPLSLRLHLERWRGLFVFGGTLLLGSLVWSIVVNGDNLAVGKLLGPQALGVYVIAYNYGLLAAITIGGAIAQVMYSAFVRVQADLRQMAALLFKAIRAIALVSMPLAIVALFASRDALVWLLGDKWAAAGPPIQVFLTTFTFLMFVAPFPVVYLAVNRPTINLLFAVGTVPVLVLAIAIGYRYGVTGVAVGVAVMMTLHDAAHVVVVSRILGVRVKETLDQVRAPAIASAAALALSGLVFLATPAFPFRAVLAGGIALPIALVVLRFGFPTTWREGVAEVRLLVRGDAA